VATAVVAVVAVATAAAEVVAAGLVVEAEAVVAALSVADPSLIPKNRARFCGLWFLSSTQGWPPDLEPHLA
jgi:hypothetical protein